MICKVVYWRPEKQAYNSARYTYRSDLPLKVGSKVIAPTAKGEKNKAIVMEINLPEETIQPAWADRVLSITEYDTEEVQV